MLRSGSISRITEGLTPKVREPKHVCDCCDPKRIFKNADKLKEHVDEVFVCFFVRITSVPHVFGPHNTGGPDSADFDETCSS